MEAEAPACKVLVVDDEQAGREGFSRFLEHAGFEAESCGDPTAALQLAGRTRYDGFVVDVLMAGLPIGHQLIAHLRADPRTAKSPILAMTGFGDDLLREALSLGADAATAKADFKNEGIPLLKRLCLGARLEAQGAARVLIVEDDEEVSELMEQTLAAAVPPFATRACGSLRAAAHQLRVWRPELVLLDLSLPDSEGLAFIPELSRLRSAGDLGVIVVSASVGDRLVPMCLHLGADDFIRKPFNGDELAARVEAVLRRVKRLGALAKADVNLLSVGPLRLDLVHKVLSGGGAPGPTLTPCEFKLLRLLFERHPETVSWGEAEKAVRGQETGLVGEASAAIRSLLSDVRAKHAPDVAACLVTRRGTGVALDVTAHP